jgi:hypothetical protein
VAPPFQHYEAEILHAPPGHPQIGHQHDGLHECVAHGASLTPDRVPAWCEMGDARPLDHRRTGTVPVRTVCYLRRRDGTKLR